MNRKQEIQNQIKPLIDELDAIHREEKEQELTTLVGRFFKYHNSYSCPESDDDRWWIYRKVTGVDGGRITATSFQTDVDGKVEIEKIAAFPSVTGWDEISESEYKNAWSELVIDIHNTNW